MAKIRMQRAFLVWWCVWITWLLGCVFLGLPIWWSRALFACFFVVEIWGALRGGGLANTLSEVMQLIERRAHPEAKWWQSWHALPLGILALLAWQAAWTAGYWERPWDRWPAGVIVGVMILAWNGWHWRDRERYG